MAAGMVGMKAETWVAWRVKQLVGMKAVETVGWLVAM